MSEQRLLTLQDACKYLSVSANTFRRMVARGDMPKPQVWGKVVRWDKEEINKIITGGSDGYG